MKPGSILAVLLAFNFTQPLAEISTDGTVGPAQNLSATNGAYTINEELGSLRGSNLFHSFQRFTINNGESATFTGSNAIQNVISRVTGGNQSVINGLLRSQIGNADFFFINPAGIVFGDNAQVDVPAAFHVSTAGELTFADGSSFNALNPEASTLTVAPPESFGFSTGQTGHLQIVGGQLRFKPGSDVSLSGNQISITDRNFVPATITVQQSNPEIEPGINLNLTSAGSSSSLTVPLNQPVNMAIDGDINLINSRINVSGNGLGSLNVRGGHLNGETSTILANNTGNIDLNDSINIHVNSLTLDNSGIYSESLNNGKAGDIEITANRLLETNNGAQIGSISSASGDTGNIAINTELLRINGLNEFSSSTGIFNEVNINSTGDAANTSVTAKSINMLQGGQIGSLTSGTGNAGDINVTTNQLTIDRVDQISPFTGIFSNTSAGSTGDAGTVNVTVNQSANLFSGGQISSTTLGDGDAESVRLSAHDLTIDGQDFNAIPTGIFSNTEFSISDFGEVIIPQGNAGVVDVTVDGSTQLLQGGVISSSTSSNGNAGSVNITTNQLTIDRVDQNSQFTGIFSNTSGGLTGSTGDAGTVNVTVNQSANVFNGGQISSTTFDDRNAGSIKLSAENLTVDGKNFIATPTGIFSNSEFSISNSGEVIIPQGNAGLVDITVDGSTQLLQGGVISSSTSSNGNAGSVNITTNQLTIDRVDQNSQFTGIFSNTSGGLAGSTGDAGTVNVTVNQSANVFNGGQISSTTFDDRNAGSIKLSAENLTIDGKNFNATPTGIFSNSELSISNSGEIVNPQGNAGSVDVTVEGSTQLLQGGVISSSTFSNGNAGTVNVTTNQLTIDRVNQNSPVTGIFSSASGGTTGEAGQVNVTVNQSANIFSGGQINSTTFNNGDGGSVKLSAQDLTIDGKDFNATATGIFTNSNNITDNTTGEILFRSNGNAGQVDVSVDDTIDLIQGGQINSTTSGQGKAGDVRIATNQLTIDGTNQNTQHTGIFSESISGAQGKAGDVDVSVNQTANVFNGGQVSSSTFGEGEAGSVKLSAHDLTIDGQGFTASTTGIFSDSGSSNNNSDDVTGDAGLVDVTVDGTTQLLQGGRVSSSTYGQGNAGTINVNTNDLLIDKRDQNSLNTGIISNARSNANGDAGNVNVNVNHSAKLLNGGFISSSLTKGNNAGAVRVNADSLLIDGQGTLLTGIFVNNLDEQSTGDGGIVQINVNNETQLLNGGRILTLGQSQVKSGDIELNTGDLLLDPGDNQNNTLITTSSSNEQGTGLSGNITINAKNNFSIRNKGSILLSSFSQGNAGNISITASKLLLDDESSIESNTSGDGIAGTITVNASNQVKLMDGGRISSETSGNGNAGQIRIETGDLIIEGSGPIPEDTEADIPRSEISTKTEGSGHAGTINITATGEIKLADGGFISSLTESQGHAGEIFLKSHALTIDGAGNDITTSVRSSAEENSEGNAGDLSISTKQLNILDGGNVFAGTSGVGKGGQINIEADNITIDSEGFSDFFTGISSSSEGANSKDAGSVDIQVTGQLTINGGGIIDTGIDSDTQGTGNAGTVTINANDIVLTDSGEISSTTNGIGNAGNLVITAEKMDILKGGIVFAGTFDEGRGGQINIEADNITIDSEGFSDFFTGISSSSEGADSKDAGSVDLQVTGQLTINGGGIEGIGIDTGTQGAGHSGNVTITANDIMLANLGEISSDTQGSGNAGTISIITNNFINDDGLISTSTQGEGKAGNISIQSKIIKVTNEGQINSVSFDTGNAGDIQINTSELIVRGIPDSEFFTGVFGLITTESTGRVGNISINSNDKISVIDNGLISISSLNENLLQNSEDGSDNSSAQIILSTPLLTLNNQSSIEARANGEINAAPIVINTSELKLSESQISTEAFNGNGAAITIDSADFIQLQNSQVTTSVNGSLNGNGGDITITSPVLVLDTGFIQANTFADQASGGDINLAVEQLIASGDRLLRGGTEPLAFDSNQANFNVVQAASPTGTSGTITITSPELNIVGILAGVKTPQLNTEKLSRDPCSDASKNTLRKLGPGGFPIFLHGENYLSVEPVDPQSELIPLTDQDVYQPETTDLRLSALSDCKKTGENWL